MGAVPNKKITRARKGRRLNSHKLSPVFPSFCSRCRSAKRPHTACPQCGYYKGRQVIEGTAAA
ncbi:MAG TPA: 50S ribosomal protein L32 [Dehalococcoidia bacterium]|nr:50S ribosomal protein L32 [Dehalococcoidia bacterium]